MVYLHFTGTAPSAIPVENAVEIPLTGSHHRTPCTHLSPEGAVIASNDTLRLGTPWIVNQVSLRTRQDPERRILGRPLCDGLRLLCRLVILSDACLGAPSRIARWGKRREGSASRLVLCGRVAQISATSGRWPTHHFPIAEKMGACRRSIGCSVVGAADGRLVVEATMRSFAVVVSRSRAEDAGLFPGSCSSVSA